MRAIIKSIKKLLEPAAQSHGWEDAALLMGVMF